MCAVSSFSMEHMLNELEAGGISCLRREEQGGMALLLADGASEREAVLKTLSRLKKAGCRVLVAVLGEEKYDNRFIWQMLLEGASDVWMWDELSGAVDMLKLQLGRWQTVERIFRSPKVQHNLIGQSEVWMAKIRQIVEIACYSQSAILIQGESGTGKELVARLIHSLDTRPDKDELVLVDCTTIVPELSGSEFFGHEKGAFTNAISTREGAFALANRGTLFLDEVGELPMPLQAELLRVIQEGTYKRVGSNQWRETRFRLVCATNRDLQAEIEAGNFRMDLYYRLANWVVHLPSLARRREDIPLLIAHFW
ncbi:MAG: sigma-54 factor interaction domain-containing protein, partial [Bacteroidetes bacterium]